MNIQGASNLYGVIRLDSNKIRGARSTSWCITFWLIIYLRFVVRAIRSYFYS